ncbi:hypothetical protein B5S32_g2497 [[Candida] boidinii]|nr:hypothetical protein B5S32_g2497 [[Candida] boidinii]
MLSLLNFISDSNSNLLLSLTQNYEQIEKNESLLKDIVESIDKNEKLIKIIGWLLIVTYKAGLFGNKHINYEDHLGADKEDEVNDTTATLQDGNGSSVNNVGTETDIDIEEEIENLHSNSAGYSFLLACKDSADSPPPSSAITSNSANTGVSTLKETTDSYSARIQEMAKLKQGNTSNESTDTRDSKLVFNLKILDMLRRFSGFRTFAKIFKDYLKLSDAYNRFPKFNKIIKENLQSRENNNKDTINDENNNIDNNDDSDPYGPRSLNFYEYLSASYINYTEDPFISSYINYLELFYETCKNFEFSSNDLILIDSNFLNMIYRNLKVRTKDEDSLNYLKFKVLLILNEQYMIILISLQKH